MDTTVGYPVPNDELERLRELDRYGIINTPSDEHFDRIVQLASLIFSAPISAISLVERERQWFLSNVGLDVNETPREQAFCAHAIVAEGVMVVPDATADPRFRANPLVTSPPYIRFYAGAPLHTRGGHKLGTLCVIDREPRQLSELQVRELQLLSQMVMHEIELRHRALLCPVTGVPSRTTFLTIGGHELQQARLGGQPLSLVCFDIDNLRTVNNRWGHAAGDGLLRDLVALVHGRKREQDYIARLGDGEFALLLVGMEGSAALELAEDLRVAVTTLPGLHSHSDFKLHVSGGVTSLAGVDRDIEDLLRRAEQALALAKGNGRNQIACLFSNP